MCGRGTIKHVPILLGAVVLVFFGVDACAGEWGLGLVSESHQAPQTGADRIEVGVLPFFYYEGERLSVDFQEISYKLIDRDNFTVAALGRIRFQGYDPDDIPELQGMDERDPSFDLGAMLAYGGQWGVVSLFAVTDATDRHNGHEIVASYALPYEYRLWTVEPSIGLRWQSENLVDYYYGVRPSEARADRPAYTGRLATNIFAGLTLSYKITRHVFAFGGAEYSYLGNNIRKSPVIEKDYEAGGFLGLLYRF